MTADDWFMVWWIGALVSLLLFAVAWKQAQAMPTTPKVGAVESAVAVVVLALGWPVFLPFTLLVGYLSESP